MKEVKPDWSEWVSNPYLNFLGKWLADVDLGKPPSDKEQAQEQFGIGWSSQDEREEVEAQEDFDESKI